jgi:stage II sporulation protein D
VAGATSRGAALFGLALAAAGAACATRQAAAARAGQDAGRRRADDGGRAVRVAVGTTPGVGRASATGEWRLYDGGGRSVLVRGGAGDVWGVERQGRSMRAVRADGVPTVLRDGPLVLRPVAAGALVAWNGKRYRGELALFATDSGILAVNRLPVEDYLRGVVPLEIGPRTDAERAAVEAQAVAARSYTYVRLDGAPGSGRSAGGYGSYGSGGAAARPYDLVNTVDDQVYGGADAERPLTDAAVEATAGQVITYAGRVVNAPYHSTCGGSTAEVGEVWYRQPPEPYLQRVSDRIPGTAGRYYCDQSPRFRWTRSYGAAALRATLDRYLRAYASVPGGGVGAVRVVAVSGTTPSGRAAGLRVETDRGTYGLRGNDVRFVLRTSGGEILNSTYFSVEPVVGRDGHLSQLTIRGAGYGHGIGMCQWGAIGRARAGQDYRTILRTYYPGTVLGRAE